MKRTTKPKSIKKRLTAKEKLFADTYVNNKNQPKEKQISVVACYLTAYNTKNKQIASQNASMALKKPHIKYYIEQQEKKINEKILDMHIIEKVEVIQGLKRIALFDPRKLYDDNYKLKHVKDLDDDTALALNTIKYGNYKLKKTIRKGKGSKAVTINKEIIKQYVAELKGESRKPAWEKLGEYLNMWNGLHQEESGQDFVSDVRNFADDIADAVPGGEL